MRKLCRVKLRSKSYSVLLKRNRQSNVAIMQLRIRASFVLNITGETLAFLEHRVIQVSPHHLPRTSVGLEKRKLFFSTKKCSSINPFCLNGVAVLYMVELLKYRSFVSFPLVSSLITPCTLVLLCVRKRTSKNLNIKDVQTFSFEVQSLTCRPSIRK